MKRRDGAGRGALSWVRPVCLGWLWVGAAGGCGGSEPDAGLRFHAEGHAFAAPPPTRPLVGTNYTHHSFEDCSWDGHGILDTWRQPGVARTVHDQLGHMRADGMGSLRLIVWHMRDVPRQDWGVVPSRGGRLPRPFRDHLTAFLDEVRRFGFHRLTVSFSPQWANNPRDEAWEPGRFAENWAFIRDVRGLVLEHGPPDVRFDLLNEGAPSDHSPELRRDRVMAYVGRLWRLYAETFGIGDATVSVIAPPTPRDRGHRLENLLAALGGSGAPLPTWFELHLNYEPQEVAWGLRYADSVLTDRGLSQPLTVGETSYDDAAVADAIAAFTSRSERPLEEVVQWFKRAGAECEVSPPYEAEAFRNLDDGDEGIHSDTTGSGNSSASSDSASARVSGVGSSGSPSGGSTSGASPELLMR